MSADVQDGFSDFDMESVLQRTVTIVFWYKENTEPIRLQHIIPTFPFFQLAKFSSLVADLGLTSSTYLDTYNPKTGKWDQHTISTVRVVETSQRLLYRIRKSIFEAIAEAECVSLSEEVNLQAKPAVSVPSTPVTTGADTVAVISRKRSASGTHNDMPAAKQRARDAMLFPNHNPAINAARPTSVAAPVSPSALPAPGSQPSSSDISISPRPPPTNLSIPPGQAPTDLSISPGISPSTLNLSQRLPHRTSGYLYQPSIFFATTPSLTTISLPHYLVHPVAEPMFIPYHSHPPLKRWPNDYTVAQLSEGFYYLEALSTHSHVTTTLPSGETTSATTPNMTQKAAFERVFGARYVKSTICRHRGLWRRAPREVREEFEAYGDDEKGIWGEFVRRVEGKPPGKGVVMQQEHIQHQANSQAQVLVPHHQQVANQHQQHGHGLGLVPPPPPGGQPMIGIPPGIPPPITAMPDHGHGHAHPHGHGVGGHGHGHGPPHTGHETLVFHAMAGAQPGMMVPVPVPAGTVGVVHGQANGHGHGHGATASQQHPSQHVSVSEESQQQQEVDGGDIGGDVGVGGGGGGGGTGGEGVAGGNDEGQTSVQSDSTSPALHSHSHAHAHGQGIGVYDPALRADEPF